MEDDVYTHLIAAARREGSTVYLRPPCTAQELARFDQQVRDALGVDNAAWYARLLRVTNGLQVDHGYFYDADEFVSNNRERRQDDPAFLHRLAFGSSGNVDLYIYDHQAAHPYRIVNFFGVDDVFETYPTLEAMLGALLRAAGE